MNFNLPTIGRGSYISLEIKSPRAGHPIGRVPSQYPHNIDFYPRPAEDAAAGIGAADLEGGEESFDLADAEPLETVTEKEDTDDEAEEKDE